jgi:hypothetical protein
MSSAEPGHMINLGTGKGCAMTTLVEPVTFEHETLVAYVGELPGIARDLTRLSPVEREERRDDVVAWVDDVLVPHAKQEERTLYEQVASVLGHPEATAPMVYDHLAIREWAARLAAVDPQDVDRLQETLYGLYALIVEHFRKEEELYAPLLGRVEPPVDYDAPALLHEP